MAEKIEGVIYEGVLSKGFGLIPKLIARDKDLSIEAKAIYAYLAAFAGNNSEAFPGIELICEELNISDRRFFKHRKILLEKGYIRVRRERLESGFSKNYYEIVQQIPQETDPSVHRQFVSRQIVSGRIVCVRNDGTNNNSLNINSLNNNSINNNKMPGKPADASLPYQAIVQHLNKMAGTNYRHTTKKTQQLIKARFKEGFTAEDFKTVIDKKTNEWLSSPHFAKYLRPETLFGTKFESYLNEKVGGRNGTFNQKSSRKYSDGVNF
nr:MAG TPA: hypothetical protein [Caudoviricetes sp.]